MGPEPRHGCNLVGNPGWLEAGRRGCPTRGGRRGMRCRGGAGAHRPRPTGRQSQSKRDGAARRRLEVEWRSRPAGESARSRIDRRRYSQVARQSREGRAAAERKGNCFFTYYMYACWDVFFTYYMYACVGLSPGMPHHTRAAHWIRRWFSLLPSSSIRLL